MAFNSKQWRSLGKYSSIYGRPKTRNPFPSVHLESCPRISSFIQPNGISQDKKESALPSIRIRKNIKVFPVKVLGDSKIAHYYHSVAQFRRKVLENKCKNIQNNQNESPSYKLTFYNPKESKKEENIRRRYVSYIGSSRNFEIVSQNNNLSTDNAKPQTTISY